MLDAEKDTHKYISKKNYDLSETSESYGENNRNNKLKSGLSWTSIYYFRPKCLFSQLVTNSENKIIFDQQMSRSGVTLIQIVIF